MSRPIHNVKYASAVYDISERRIRYLAQLRGIGTKVGGSLVFTGGDIKKLKPGKNGYPKGRPRGKKWDGPIAGVMDLSGIIASDGFFVPDCDEWADDREILYGNLTLKQQSKMRK